MEYICKHCVFFKPNIYYPFIGYCILREEGTRIKVEVCRDFRKSSFEELKNILREQGWLYCVTCGRVITDEKELEEHVREHLITTGVVIDEAVSEEAPMGD